VVRRDGAPQSREEVIMSKGKRKVRLVKSRTLSKSGKTTRRAKSERVKSSPKTPAREKLSPTHPKTRTSKQDTVLTLLRRPDGATIAAMMEATGWQAHSVRGFLAGVVRRKLKLMLQSDKTDGERVYRVTGEHDDSEAQAA
jgi:Protein of unknown function (DUF3489)